MLRRRLDFVFFFLLLLYIAFLSEMHVEIKYWTRRAYAYMRVKWGRGEGRRTYGVPKFPSKI